MAEKSFNTLIDSIGNMSVIELSDFVKALEEKFGVSAAMPMAAAAAPVAAAPVAEEKSEYKVTLESSGPEKIKTIKALRTVVAELNLTDAKKMVEEAPQVIKEAAPKDLANKIKEALEAAGAKVKLS
ncbi:MAG: 50S ribosomal protein L7/L12 [Candidatus Dependentiae bacterium]|nr:50S ribosomal protein L7/L12 [Candidatus Dependentiae bacterium]